MKREEVVLLLRVAWTKEGRVMERKGGDDDSLFSPNAMLP